MRLPANSEENSGEGGAGPMIHPTAIPAFILTLNPLLPILVWTTDVDAAVPIGIEGVEVLLGVSNSEAVKSKQRTCSVNAETNVSSLVNESI
jgi:hypothetical protein